MKKKGQGLSMNVIIIAAIGLVIMVVLIAIFTGRIGGFGQKLAKEEAGFRCAEELGGEWKDVCPDGKKATFGVTHSQDLAMNSGRLCCVDRPEE